MDSGDDGRCLPSMWTRRGDRLDFMDMCASPPSDGFFYANNQRMNKTQVAKTQGSCTTVNEEKNKEATLTNSTTIQSSSETVDVSCVGPTGGLFKSFVPAYQPTSGSTTTGELSPGEGFMVSGKILNMSPFELEKWAKDNVRGPRQISPGFASPQDDISFDDSALTPADHHSSTHLRNPTITKTDVGGSKSLVDKLSTPDVTPCSTPVATPVCSPQVVRKSGNPFFTGDPSRKDDGNWLFRSAPKETMANTLYEATVEIQSQPNSQALKKKVKYVPRPSHLRELNFWSPTSM